MLIATSGCKYLFFVLYWFFVHLFNIIRAFNYCTCNNPVLMIFMMIINKEMPFRSRQGKKNFSIDILFNKVCIVKAKSLDRKNPSIYHIPTVKSVSS